MKLLDRDNKLVLPVTQNFKAYYELHLRGRGPGQFQRDWEDNYENIITPFRAAMWSEE